jgi:hypothetical protein
MAPDTYPAATNLRREVHYNTFKPFRLAWLLYLFGFFSLLASLTLGGTLLGRAGLGLSFAAFVIHAYGMVIRSLISGRPPVTNMYESVIWVAWGAMLFALIFEAVYRVRFFAACAGAVAVISLILADNVPILDGAIDPLVPVLRDNMWLTIHVLTITLSYAAFFLAMAIAHVCLGLYFFSPGRRICSPRCRCSSTAACRWACSWERREPCSAGGGPRIPGDASGAGTRRRRRSSSRSCSTWPSCTGAWSACCATSGRRWRECWDSSAFSGPGTASTSCSASACTPTASGRRLRVRGRVRGLRGGGRGRGLAALSHAAQEGARSRTHRHDVADRALGPGSPTDGGRPAPVRLAIRSIAWEVIE